MVNQDTPPYSSPIVPVIHLGLLLLVVVVAYSNTLYSPFILDDLSCIQYNDFLKLYSLSPQYLFEAAFSGPMPTRPVANISFALDYYFNQEVNIVSLHLTNIAIHCMNGVFLYYFALLTLKTPALRNKYHNSHYWIPLLTALLWAAHPLHTQSVTYLVQRMNSLAVLFYLLAFIFYIHARYTQKKSTVLLFTAASLTSGALAAGTKEITITLPVFILLYEFFFFRDLSKEWIRQKTPLLIALFAGMLAAFFIKFGLFFWETIPASYATRDFSLIERLLTEPRVIVFYLSLLFLPLPSRLNLEHDFQLSHGLIDPHTTLPAIFLLILLPLMAILITKKHRLLAFAILWFLGNLALESTFIPLEIIFEHRTYLPSMMVCLALVTILYQIVPHRTLLPLLIVLITLLTIGTYQRNETWRNEITILIDSARKSPNKARPHVHLGEALIARKKYPEAVVLLKKAISLDTTNHNAMNSLGVAYARTGDFALAIDQFRQVLEIEPSHITARENMLQAIKDSKHTKHPTHE